MSIALIERVLKKNQKKRDTRAIFHEKFQRRPHAVATRQTLSLRRDVTRAQDQGAERCLTKNDKVIISAGNGGDAHVTPMLYNLEIMEYVSCTSFLSLSFSLCVRRVKQRAETAKIYGAITTSIMNTHVMNTPRVVARSRHNQRDNINVKY